MRRAGAAALICLLLAVFHTWPLASAPQRHSLNYNADAQLTAWIVSWIAYALPHEPRNLFAGNIFQPDDRVLSYSEPLVVPALVGAPVRWLGGSAVLTINLLLIIGLAATALAGWWVVDRWTGSFGAGLVAGALLAFNAHLLTRLPHVQAAHAWGLPLVFYLTDRLLALDHADVRGARQVTVGLAVVVAAVAMTSVYWLFFAGTIVAVCAAVGLRSLRAARRLAVAGALAAVLALPVLLPYLRLAGEGVRRPLEQAAQFPATLSGYLVSLSFVDGIWGRRLYTRDINVLFPGVVALLLALVGLLGSDPKQDSWGLTPGRRRCIALLAIAGVGFILSFGPSTPIYRLAYYVVLPLQGLRVPARFGYLPLFSIALLAGLGVAALERRARSRVARVGIPALALFAATAEAWHGPVRTTPFTGVPRIYARLDAEPRPALLVETPFWVPEAVYGNGEFVLNATEHRTPIMNGYSGITPDLYRKRAQWFWFFPEPWAIAAMRKEGATHVMVHLEQFGPEAESVKAALSKQHELELIAEDQRGHRLYRFTSPQ